MRRLIFGLVMVGCGTSSNTVPYPTWEEAEQRRQECDGATVAIQVDSIEIQAEGTRSQRMVLEARVLNSSDPSLGEQLNADQYVGGDAFMHTGERYIVALCPSSEGRQVIGWKPLVVGAIPEANDDEAEPDVEQPETTADDSSPPEGETL